MMGIEILWVEQQADQFMPYHNDPQFIESLRSRATRVLADTAMRQASIYQRIDPKEGENPTVRHRWAIGIERDMSALEALERQLERARSEGRAQAAAIVRSYAARYKGLAGPCGHVIKHALEDAAKAIAESPGRMT